MAQASKTKVFMSGRSQAVRIPLEFRFSQDEVFIRRDAQTGDLILSEKQGRWADVYAALDHACLPEKFLADREQGPSQERPAVQ